MRYKQQFAILLRKHAARMKTWKKYLEQMEKARHSVKNKAKAKLSGPKRNTKIGGGLRPPSWVQKNENGYQQIDVQYVEAGGS